MPGRIIRRRRTDCYRGTARLGQIRKARSQILSQNPTRTGTFSTHTPEAPKDSPSTRITCTVDDPEHSDRGGLVFTLPLAAARVADVGLKFR
jgi:hypothetical protein